MSGFEVLGAVAASIALARVSFELADTLKEFVAQYRDGGSSVWEQHRRSLLYLARIAKTIAPSSISTERNDNHSLETNDIVTDVLNDLLSQVEKLLEELRKISPGPHGKRRQKFRIAFQITSKVEKKIRDGMQCIDASRSNLILALCTANSISASQLGSIVVSRNGEDQASEEFTTSSRYELGIPLRQLKTRSLDDWNPKIPGAHFVVPHLQNSRFVGREDVLDTLIDHARSKDITRLAIVAIGGGGKTSVVVEMLYRLQKTDSSPDIFWIKANDLSSFDRSCEEIAREALEIHAQHPRSTALRKTMRDWFEDPKRRPWILIVDGADDEYLSEPGQEDVGNSGPKVSLREVLPSGTRGKVILTTRNKKVAVRLAGSNHIVLPEISVDEGVNILQRHVSGDDSGITFQEQAKVLVQDLALLPLAIVQAGSYVNAKSMLLSDYSKLFAETDDTRLALLGEDFYDNFMSAELRHDGTQANNAVGRTWLLSFTKISEDEPLATEYLSLLCTYCDQACSLELLPHSTTKTGIEALGTLKAYSFASIQDSKITMHRLVRLAARGWLESANKTKHFREKAVQRLATLAWELSQSGEFGDVSFYKNAFYLLTYSDFVTPNTEADLVRMDVLLLTTMALADQVNPRYDFLRLLSWNSWANAAKIHGRAAPQAIGRLKNLITMIRNVTTTDGGLLLDLSSRVYVRIEEQVMADLEEIEVLVSKCLRGYEQDCGSATANPASKYAIFAILLMLTEISELRFFISADAVAISRDKMVQTPVGSHSTISRAIDFAWQLLFDSHLESASSTAKSALGHIKNLSCCSLTTMYQSRRCQLILSQILVAQKKFDEATDMILRLLTDNHNEIVLTDLDISAAHTDKDNNDYLLSLPLKAYYKLATPLMMQLYILQGSIHCQRGDHARAEVHLSHALGIWDLLDVKCDTLGNLDLRYSMRILATSLLCLSDAISLTSASKIFKYLLEREPHRIAFTAGRTFLTTIDIQTLANAIGHQGQFCEDAAEALSEALDFPSLMITDSIKAELAEQLDAYYSKHAEIREINKSLSHKAPASSRGSANAQQAGDPIECGAESTNTPSKQID